MKQRRKGDGNLISDLTALEKSKKEIFLLHEHPNALDVITQGMRADQ